MDGSIGWPPKTKEDLEGKLLEELRLRQVEWARASEKDRDLARYRFMNALYAFTNLVISREPPK